MPFGGPGDRRDRQRVAVGVGVVAQTSGPSDWRESSTTVSGVVDRDRGVVDGAVTVTVTVAVSVRPWRR